MSAERNLALERLFAAADRDLGDENFVARVMARTSTLRTRRLMIVLVVCLVTAPATWFVAGPFNDALLWFTQFLAQPIAGTGDGVASPVVPPINSVGGALALGLLVLRAIRRRLFSARS
ncbi:MAG TPA: hypothetical protein VIH25_07120 [Steroidobacteraceae bacterium]